MCKAPVLIKNPNYGSLVKNPLYHQLHNTKDTHIPVPCGRCASCIHLKQIYLVQRVQMEALNHDLFYGTLTYNQEMLPVALFGDIRFAYPDYSDWQKMIKMVRKDFPDLKFKYMLVSEYGGKKHRPHYHFILSLPKSSDLLADKYSSAIKLFDIFLTYWRRNVGSTRVPIWKPLFTYKHTPRSYNYDLHWLDPYSSKDGIDGVSFYVTKYILKYDDWIDKFKSKLYFNLPHDDYVKAWNLFRPRLLLSKGFGSPYDKDVQSHILQGIQTSLESPDALFPFYISRQNGSTYPLSPYYSKKFLNIESQLVFISRRPDQVLTYDDFVDFDKRQDNLSEIRDFLNSQTMLYDYDDIDDINCFENGNFYEIPKLGEDFADSWQDFDDACRCD